MLALVESQMKGEVGFDDVIVGKGIQTFLVSPSNQYSCYKRTRDDHAFRWVTRHRQDTHSRVGYVIYIMIRGFTVQNVSAK